MSRLLFVLIGVFALSCAEDSPTQTDLVTEAAAIGDLVSINGAAYRRVAAKPAATQADYAITITIPLSTSDDGELYLSETITIGDVVYTSNCDALTQSAQDDVGNTRETATELTVPTPTPDGNYWRSAMYQLTPGDVDYFVPDCKRGLRSARRIGADSNLYRHLWDSDYVLRARACPKR